MIKLNGTIIKFPHFPNGETIIQVPLPDLLSTDSINSISLYYENDIDLINLMWLKKYLDDFSPSPNLLHFPYLPYSRMDRKIEDMGFGLRYLSEFINSLNFDGVSIGEPHSDVSLDLINFSKPSWATQEIYFDLVSKLRLKQEHPYYLVFPDKGAEQRYNSLIEHDSNIIIGQKIRDPKTGKITSLEIDGDFSPNLETAVIVDDLCSRGGTFLGTIELLKAKGVKRVFLCVAHCEPIISLELLNHPMLVAVHTTNSMGVGRELEHHKLVIREVFND